MSTRASFCRKICILLTLNTAMSVLSADTAESSDHKIGIQFELLLGAIKQVPEETARSWSYTSGVGIVATDDPRDLRMAIRNLGAETISSEQNGKLFMAGKMCVSRPNGRVIRTNQFIVRGPIVPSKRGNLSLFPGGIGADFFKMEQPGRYMFWWETGKNRSNAVVFDVTDTGISRVVP